MTDPPDRRTDPAIPVASLRDLITKWLESEGPVTYSTVDYFNGRNSGRRDCAKELSALLAEPVIPQSEQEQNEDIVGTAIRELVAYEQKPDQPTDADLMPQSPLDWTYVGMDGSRWPQTVPTRLLPPEPVQALIAEAKELAATKWNPHDSPLYVAARYHNVIRQLLALLAIPPDPSEQKEEKDHARVDDSQYAEHLSTASSNEANPPCNRCGGPHPFDTSVPSVLWNQVIRKGGPEIADYLCLTCIVKAFAADRVSFTAHLSSAEFNRLPIEIQIESRESRAVEAVQAENNRLRIELRDVASRPTCRTCVQLRPLKGDVFACPLANMRIHASSVDEFGCIHHAVDAIDRWPDDDPRDPVTAAQPWAEGGRNSITAADPR